MCVSIRRPAPSHSASQLKKWTRPSSPLFEFGSEMFFSLFAFFAAFYVFFFFVHFCLSYPPNVPANCAATTLEAKRWMSSLHISQRFILWDPRRLFEISFSFRILKSRRRIVSDAGKTAREKKNKKRCEKVGGSSCQD